MTVTAQAVDLQQPNGELACEAFPDNNLDKLLGGWLVQAKRKVEANANIPTGYHDDAAKQWVYSLAYDYLAQRFASMPNQASVNKGADSVSYGQDRPAYWNTKASMARSMYDGFIVGDATRPAVAFSGPIPTQAIF